MTTNIMSLGSAAACLEAIPPKTMVIAMQEHHVQDDDKLASFQGEVADFGFSGIWAPAVPSGTSEAGTSAGVAILAR
eukprot:8336596-Pyramimonas_sp.AAC.1